MKDRLVAQAVAQMLNRLCSFLWSHFARVISILCRRRYFVSVFYGILQRTLCPPFQSTPVILVFAALPPRLNYQYI